MLLSQVKFLQEIKNFKAAITLAGALAFPYFGAFLGFILVTKNMEWYGNITKPDFTAPPWVFGLAWGFCYGTMGVASYLVFRQVYEGVEVVSPLIVYLIHLLINWLWIPAFFGLRQIKAVNFPVALILFSIKEFIVLFFFFFSQLEYTSLLSPELCTQPYFLVRLRHQLVG